MQFSDTTPRVNRTIAGLTLSVIQPYAEGHVVTSGEAQMLNQTLAENFSNNLRKRIEEFVPEGSPEGTAPRLATVEEAQAIYEAYAAEYQPGVRTSSGGGRQSLDPIETEMREIATQKLKDLLKSKGLKQKDVEFTTLRDKILNDHGPALRAAAEKVIRQREATKVDGDDLFATVASGLPGMGEPAEAPEAAAA